MDLRKPTVDQCSIYRRTHRSKDYVEDTILRAKRLVEDPDRKQREADGRCKSCHYLFRSRMGCAVVTRQECGLCNTILHSGSSAIDDLCQKCAVSNSLCRQCGGDLHLRIRRKFKPESASQAQSDT